jgi:hypothetical protein
MIELRFDSVRSDWYAANSLLPRLLVNAILGRERLLLAGFPMQWIPVCVHYGIHFKASRSPVKYLPLFSDLSLRDIRFMAESAKRRGASRALLEAAAALDPVIADLVYIVDHRLAAAGYTDSDKGQLNILNTWHSFTRPDIVRLQERMCRYVVDSEAILLLPCSRHRPYSDSRTHARLVHKLVEAGYNPSHFGHVVVTALGVVPSHFWLDPIVMTYDAGAVDLWRVFQLLRVFFTKNRPRLVLDCLSFKPYSDMVGILRDLGAVTTLLRPLKLRWRAFHVDLVP